MRDKKTDTRKRSSSVRISSTRPVKKCVVTHRRVKMWRLVLEVVLLGGICLLFAGSVSVAEVIVAGFAGCMAALVHGRLIKRSAFRFTGTPQPLHILKLAAKGGLRDVPQGAWHVLASLWRGRFGKQVMEPAPVLVSDTDVRVTPKRRALAILTTSFGPLAYTVEAHRQALRVHRAIGTTRSE
jgi:hypothetical protein